MFYQRWLLAVTLMLIGMGTFFFIAALLTFVVWVSVGNWRQFLAELAMVAMVVTIPVAYYAWRYSVARRL